MPDLVLCVESFEINLGRGQGLLADGHLSPQFCEFYQWALVRCMYTKSSSSCLTLTEVDTKQSIIWQRILCMGVHISFPQLFPQFRQLLAGKTPMSTLCRRPIIGSHKRGGYLEEMYISLMQII